MILSCSTGAEGYLCGGVGRNGKVSVSFNDSRFLSETDPSRRMIIPLTADVNGYKSETIGVRKSILMGSTSRVF